MLFSANLRVDQRIDLCIYLGEACMRHVGEARDDLWQIVELAKPTSEAKFVIAHSEYGFTANIPIESIEVTKPVVVERFELIPDSAGPGRFRGGCGLSRQFVRLLRWIFGLVLPVGEPRTEAHRHGLQELWEVARWERLDQCDERLTLDGVAELESGPRGKFNPNGPNSALLRSPDLMARNQKVGEYLRYGSSIPARLNEFALLITAREWTAQIEWVSHHDLAVKAGVSPAVLADLAQGRRPAGMTEDEAIVYDF